MRVPGPVRAMVHSAPGMRVAGQLCVEVKLVVAIWRLAAARVPRLRRVMLGESSAERARLGAAVGLMAARNAADPAQRLPEQVPGVRAAAWRVEGRAVVGEL